jgi:DNA-binding NarL/FixJ family response regulator
MLFKRCMPEGNTIEVHEAHDLPSAMTKARDSRPDIVVLDYNLPSGNGVALARAMQEAGVNAKYVLLTANTQRAVVQAANDVGFHAVLEKPITKDVVAAALKVLNE